MLSVKRVELFLQLGARQSFGSPIWWIAGPTIGPNIIKNSERLGGKRVELFLQLGARQSFRSPIWGIAGPSIGSNMTKNK